MGKPAFCISENKDADQLCGKRTGDQRLCFRFTGLRPIYAMFFKFLPISFQMKNYDEMWL